MLDEPVTTSSYGELLFTWLSLVMSLMVSFCAVLFPQDVQDEILIKSVSEGFPTHSLFWFSNSMKVSTRNMEIPPKPGFPTAA